MNVFSVNCPMSFITYKLIANRRLEWIGSLLLRRCQAYKILLLTLPFYLRSGILPILVKISSKVKILLVIFVICM